MKNVNGRTSSDEENKKAQTGKQAEKNPVREDKNNSIYQDANNEEAYPYKSKTDKQFKTQPEFIDRDNDSKDKS